MSLIPLNLNEVQEPKPVPTGRYDLQITACEETKTRVKGLPQFHISIAIEGHDDAPSIQHYMGIPSEVDESSALQFKGLLMKRFLTLFKVPFNAESIDTEALAMEMVGCKANAEVGIDKEKDSDGNEKPDGNVYNRLIVPKMRGENQQPQRAAAGKR